MGIAVGTVGQYENGIKVMSGRCVERFLAVIEKRERDQLVRLLTIHGHPNTWSTE